MLEQYVNDLFELDVYSEVNPTHENLANSANQVGNDLQCELYYYTKSWGKTQATTLVPSHLCRQREVTPTSAMADAPTVCTPLGE